MGKFKNLTGMKFGKLAVLEMLDERYVSPSGYTHIQYLCECSCKEKTKIVTLATALRGGNTQSCGCVRRDKTIERNKSGFKDMTGLRFGMLVVRRIAEKHITQSGNLAVRKYWFCDCDCGNTCITRRGTLLSGRAVSCGCLHESLVASEIKKYCIDKYGGIPEYSDLRNKETGMPLRYDVYIPIKNIFIEVNPIHHYKYVKHFHRSLVGYKKMKGRDRLKKKHALENGFFIEIDTRKHKTTKKSIEYLEACLLDAGF